MLQCKENVFKIHNSRFFKVKGSMCSPFDVFYLKGIPLGKKKKALPVFKSFKVKLNEKEPFLRPYSCKEVYLKFVLYCVWSLKAKDPIFTVRLAEFE